MNTQKQAMSKIAHIQKEELSEVEKLELSNINDLIKVLNEAEDDYKNFNNLYEQVDNLAPKIIVLGNKIVAAQNKISSINNELERKFAEIGLRFSDYPESKKIISFMSKSMMIESMTSSIKKL